MTTRYKSESKEFWDERISEIEERKFTREEARNSYEAGDLKDGEIILVTGEMTREEAPAWVVAVFINQKFIFVKHSANDIRLARLKRLAIAKLFDAIEQKWVDVRQAPWLPVKMQNLEDPTQVLHGKTSNSDFNDRSQFEDEKQVIEEKDAHEMLEKELEKKKQ